MALNPYSEGYHAGLVNDRANPEPIWSVSWLLWHHGNSLGVDIHCAVVEAIYIRNMEEE